MHRVHPVNLVSAIIISMALSAVLGYNYAFTRVEPRTVVEKVGVLQGQYEDLPVEFNGTPYNCDLWLYGNLDPSLPVKQDRAVCDPVTNPSP